jgi:hypothetical protein
MSNKTAQIVRINKATGDVRPSTLDEVERIIHLNYHHPDLAMDRFKEGGRIESPFAYYEIRHEESVPPASAGGDQLAKEAA